MDIKNIIICGLGAIGCTYAYLLKDCSNLKILVDKNRLKKYQQNPKYFNNEILDLDYILPNDNFEADLIIISTKANALQNVIKNIKNFVKENTIILSLINGISSENILVENFEKEHVIHSYYIGSSAIKNGNNITHKWGEKIVFGSPFKDNTVKIITLKEFFDKNNINYEYVEDIIYSQWVKFGVNICLNQTSAIYRQNVGELRNNKDYINLLPKLINEVKAIATQAGVKNLNNFENDITKSISLISDEGITSMLQDILSKRQTEVDIFAGEIIRLGKQYNIQTPYNMLLYKKIKEIEGEY